jgi:hypothetical protein
MASEGSYLDGIKVEILFRAQSKKVSLSARFLKNGEILKWPTRADCKSAAQASKVRILLSPQLFYSNIKQQGK